MADIKARLLEAIGGFKVPQHKKEGLNEFEITEGKDGKMNVRDTDVHARLDAIEQKLNGTLETRLTGSIVEVYLETGDVTLAPGESLVLGDLVARKGSKIVVLFRGETYDTDSYTVGIEHRTGGGSTEIVWDEIITPERTAPVARTYYKAISENPITSFYRVTITNDSDVDKTLNQRRTIMEVL